MKQAGAAARKGRSKEKEEETGVETIGRNWERALLITIGIGLVAGIAFGLGVAATLNFIQDSPHHDVYYRGRIVAAHQGDPPWREYPPTLEELIQHAEETGFMNRPASYGTGFLGWNKPR